MSSALNGSPAKTWWSKQPSSSKQPVPSTRPYPKHSGITFNSFVSAMGFKSKKHPTLAIHDPPPLDPFPTPSYPSRPPSKSVSSTRSPIDSVGPPTPSDPHRHSLLTLSDIDPFAGRGVITVSAPQTPYDPNRLSAYSNPSVTDVSSKKSDPPAFNRVSYASSSSMSHSHHATEFYPLSPTVSPPDTSRQKKIKTKKSAPNLHHKVSFDTTDPSTSPRRPPIPTRKEMSPRPDTSPSTVPTARRGVTGRRPSILSSTSSRPGSSHNSPSQNVSPRVVVRQPSVSRIGLPPCAPPSHELPAPPLFPVKDQYADEDSANLPGCTSASSSSLSFVSPPPQRRDLLQPESTHNPRLRDNRSPDHYGLFHSSEPDYVRDVRSKPKSSQSPPTFPRALKKASSQSSLGKRVPQPLGSMLSPSGSDKTSEKAPKKQRSFQIPLPPLPLPLRHTASVGPVSPPISENGVVDDQRRGSAGSGLSTRKRLFSGSSLRRPSTSQCTPVDDDTQSIFSVRSDTDKRAPSSRFKSWTTQNSSFWEEAPIDTAATTPIQDYVPQSIISAAEIAELEASMDASLEISSPRTRPRGLSIMSQSTTASNVDTENQTTSLPPPPPRPRLNIPARTNSLIAKSSSLVPRMSARPSTAQPNLSPTPDESFFRRSSSPPPIINSLPPPPRPRNRPRIVTEPLDRPTPFVTSLPPPPRRPPIKPKTVPEKSLLRQSLMRKPSFLNIDDESDGESDLEDTHDPLNGGSFLDLARESFDTTRSD